jgi:hypothetical protein
MVPTMFPGFAAGADAAVWPNAFLADAASCALALKMETDQERSNAKPWYLR